MKKSMKLVGALVFGIYLGSFAADRTFDITDGTGKVVGQGILSEDKNIPKVSLDLKGVQPGTHAIHIHEKGLCEGPKFATAGGHLNPQMKKHGHHNSAGPHLGDLGNIEIPANGNLKKDLILKGISLKEGAKNSISTPSGTSIIIHALADDEKTDPSGASGDRLYCGVLQEAQAAAPASKTK